jgi:hypothetical protein
MRSGNGMLFSFAPRAPCMDVQREGGRVGGERRNAPEAAKPVKEKTREQYKGAKCKVA